MAICIHGNSYIYTWQWLYIHAPCKPDSLPANTNYCLNTSRLSTIKRNEHYLLMQVLTGQYTISHITIAMRLCCLKELHSLLAKEAE